MTRTRVSNEKICSSLDEEKIVRSKVFNRAPQFFPEDKERRFSAKLVKKSS